jgi:hypothetical protein
MSRSGGIDDPEHWRHRAAEMRALADCMAQVEAMAIMAKLAGDYDKLADRAQECSDVSSRVRLDHSPSQ